MDLILFIKGALAGFTIAAPVGPVGILCAQRTLSRGFVAGVTAGTGAAIADTIFGVFAAFGLTFVAEFLLSHETYMRLFGGTVMLAMGIHILLKRVSLQGAGSTSVRGAAGDVVTSFVLAITNPITILSFSPAFLAFGAVVAPGEITRAWTLVAGVLVGSMLWWVLLCVIASLFKRRLTDRAITILSRISGGMVLMFGVLVLLSVTVWGGRLIGALPA